MNPAILFLLMKSIRENSAGDYPSMGFKPQSKFEKFLIWFMIVLGCIGIAVAAVMVLLLFGVGIYELCR